MKYLKGSYPLKFRLESLVKSYNKPKKHDIEKDVEVIDLEEKTPSEADFELADAMIEYYREEL
jgi:hypothetical protein